MDLAVAVYGLTKGFPLEERYALTSQIRRAAVSIPSNISEGHQQGTKSYGHFITLALGSLAETGDTARTRGSTPLRERDANGACIRARWPFASNPAWAQKVASRTGVIIIAPWSLIP